MGFKTHLNKLEKSGLSSQEKRRRRSTAAAHGGSGLWDTTSQVTQARSNPQMGLGASPGLEVLSSSTKTEFGFP